MNSMRVLYAVVAIQFAVMGGMWLSTSQQQAVAQIPDQGAQLQTLIDENKAINTKMDRLLQLLESGKMQVKMVPVKDK